MSTHWVIDTTGVPAVAASPPQSSLPRGGDGATLTPQFMSAYRQNLAARYDAAGTSPEMEAWWSGADAKSPRSSASKLTRSRIRRRARYECYESGSIANGMLEAWNNAVIGCGPTLQMQFEDKELNRLIEEEWREFARQIRLTEKLRTMFPARGVDGEAFAEKVSNPTLTTPVKFDIRLSESDLWTNPFHDVLTDPNEDDGIRYDAFGNPVSYRRMRQHPGDDHIMSTDLWAYDDIPARYVIHWFKRVRPGQRRGVSEFASSLRPLAELRRYQMAVQAAAETAANHAGVMFSTASYYSESPGEIHQDDILQNVPTPRNSLLTLPEGWDMKQLKAEQPTTQYVEFVEERVAAAARPIQMPLNIAMGSSRNHNFASAKLDRMQFNAANVPTRKNCEAVVLDRVFQWWLFEANRIPEYLPVMPDRVPHSWQWPIDEPIDVVAQANADEKYWNMGLLTDERYCKREGLDVDDLREQQKRQQESRDEIGDNFPKPGIQMSQSIMDPNAPAPQMAGANDE